MRNGFFRTQHTYGLESSLLRSNTHTHTRHNENMGILFFFSFSSVFHPSFALLTLSIFLVYLSHVASLSLRHDTHHPIVVRTLISLLTMPGSIKGQYAPRPYSPRAAVARGEKNRNLQKLSKHTEMSPLCSAGFRSTPAVQYLYPLCRRSHTAPLILRANR